MNPKRIEIETGHDLETLDRVGPLLQRAGREAEAAAATMPRTEEGVRALQTAVYGLVERVRVAAPLACGSGCASCCSQRVAVMPYEAALAYLVAPAEQLGRAVRLAAGYSRMSQAERSRAPCPLLTEARCSIYTARPAACRTEHSFSREACEKGWGHTHPYDGIRELVAFAVTIGEAQGLREQGLDNQPIELVAALAHLERQYGQQRGRPLLEWLAGRRIFPRSLHRWLLQRQRGNGASQLVQLRIAGGSGPSPSSVPTSSSHCPERLKVR
jgi:Fe-S-cluster containining protein